MVQTNTIWYGIYIKLMYIIDHTKELWINLMRIFPNCGPKVYKSDKRVDGKVIIITGANSGIGREVAEDLARRGGKIILACRSVSKAEIVVKKILKVIPSAKLVVKQLDLASLESVREFADEINKEESHVDYLINNAGIMMCPKGTTKEGFEMQFGTNHLGHFLLTILLLDKLKACPTQARIINVSSIAHVLGKINFDDINLDKNYSPFYSYAQSKLANILFTRELARKLEGTNVVTFSLHPGIIATDIWRHVSGIGGFFISVFVSLFKIDTFLGSQTTLFCVLSDDIGESESGSYYANCHKCDLYKHARDDVAARRLWDLSSKMIIMNMYPNEEKLLILRINEKKYFG